jgi:hypothetical protein
MDKKYFCLNIGNTQNSLASFLDFDNFITFMVGSLSNRAKEITTFKTNNTFTKTEDQMAENIAKFITNSWPNKKTTDVFAIQKETDTIKDRIKTIKDGILKAKSLGL